MTDIHTHCLPGIDDGAKNSAESMAMLRAAYSQEVRVCAATPHCFIHREESIEQFIAYRGASYERLAEKIRRDSGTLYPEILLGAEVYLDNDISAYHGVERLCIGNTRYMLVELPHENRGKRIDNWLYSLGLKGIIPIIAHIDRYPDMEEIIAEFKGLRLIYQVNAARLLSFWGRRRIKRLLDYDFKYIAASDMHNTIRRKCNIQRALAAAERHFSTDKDRLVFDFDPRRASADIHIV